jgi:hypothetical protein
MSAQTRLGVFALVLAGTFATAYGMGEALPGHLHGSAPADHAHDTGAPLSGADPHAAHGANGAGAGIFGLTSVVDGHSVVITDDGRAGRLELHIERNGRAVTGFEVVHGARLHLLLISDDLSSFQHLHPLMDDGGTWTTPVSWPVGGPYRVVIDIDPSEADPMALGIDLTVPGEPSAVPLASPDDDVITPEGLRVERDGAAFSVTPTDGLEPYLGQAAHLVAFRAGNGSYRHLHAEDAVAPGQFRFAWDLPRGTWRLFLQFSRLGQVVTVPSSARRAGDRRSHDHRNDLRGLRLSYREEAQPPRCGGRIGQLRHRTGPGHVRPVDDGARALGRCRSVDRLRRDPADADRSLGGPHRRRGGRR